MDKAPALDDAIAEAVRRLRAERGWTREDLTLAMRTHALLPWTPDVVRHIEDGSRIVSTSEFVLLFLVFRVTEEEFFQGSFAVSPGWEFEPGGITAALSGTLLPEQVPHREIDAERVAEAHSAEAHAAERLGISVLELRKRARRRWGRSLPQERDARLTDRLAGEDVSLRRRQALRGHITRTMLTELKGKTS